MQWKWYADKKRGGFYASRNAVFEHGRRKKILMHRFIMEAPDGRCVDHKNHDTLDNRRSNLRICSQRENVYNSRLRKDNTSGFHGVHLDKWAGKYRVKAYVNGKSTYIGTSDSALCAAKMYDAFIIKHRGEYALTNFPIV
jgi:hypothetical protein